MRVNIHDFSGHPFAVQLSRRLAARGHTVAHTYCAQYVSGHGRLAVAPDDPPGFSVTPLRASVPFRKYSPLARLAFEANYARATVRFLRRSDFDLVILCNVPLGAHVLIQAYLRMHKTAWIFWHQDVYSDAIANEIRARLPRSLHWLARLPIALERRLVRRASSVVAIGTSFVDRYRQWGLPTAHVSVQPNWSPLDEIRPAARDNAWSKTFDLASDTFRVMYAGTLGRKHNPLLLLTVLDRLKDDGVRAELIVCSEGRGAEVLAQAAAGRPDVRILGFQPIEQFSETLSSADAVVAVLEPAASAHSIPSKVLSYFAAGRVVVGLVPASNPITSEIVEAGGFVAEPDEAGATDAAHWLAKVANNDTLATELRDGARHYAERHFDIDRIADTFEQLMTTAVRDRVK